MGKHIKELRLTPQRRMILDALKESTNHPSAEDIYEKVRQQYPNISFKTVYNTLEAFQENGIIQELLVEPRKKRYCPDPAPHHHLVCSRCRTVVDIFHEFPIDLPDEFAQGFNITKRTITFYGLCEDCAE